ncbi:MerR family transcriptional regulator [Plantibacter sp. Mn2098]|uniref:MerR family transcriptional regulator n=1 Tax=Plantibacter sp. Mn2098 TaxID=3395266 RepID=UPI003BE7ECCB
MYTIGEFAALGRVSVRMLRHYDAIGLLRPASVDASSGYRHYEVTQLRTLLRIVELRDLGCSLDDAADVLAAPRRWSTTEESRSAAAARSTWRASRSRSRTG